MFKDLGIVSLQTVLDKEILLNILRKRLHALTQDHMDVPLQISGIVLDQVGLKVPIRVLRGGHNRNAVRTNESER